MHEYFHEKAVEWKDIMNNTYEAGFCLTAFGYVNHSIEQTTRAHAEQGSIGPELMYLYEYTALEL